MKQPLRNFHGKIIGFLEDKPTEIVLSEYSGRILGRYDKINNKTRNYLGTIIGSGNLLTSLLNG